MSFLRPSSPYHHADERARKVIRLHGPFAAAPKARLLRGVDDVDKLRLERRAADEEAVDVGTSTDLLAVGRGDGAAVDDAGRLGH